MAASSRIRLAWWAWLHNVVAHGLEGWWCLLTLGAPVPGWLDRFHDWTAGRAWPHE